MTYEEVKQIMTDAVQHPSHYTHGGIECIEAIRASMTADGFCDYCKGNIIKYIWRWRDKGGVEDLRKASVYLDWLINAADEKEKDYVKETNASQCPNHETVKESGAYLCGVLDERKRKRTNADRIRSMSDDELATHLHDIGWDCHLCAEHGRLDNEPLLRGKKCDEKCVEHCLEWLKKPAEVSE